MQIDKKKYNKSEKVKSKIASAVSGAKLTPNEQLVPKVIAGHPDFIRKLIKE